MTESGNYIECAPKAWEWLGTLLDKLTQAECTDFFIGISGDNPHSSYAHPRDRQIRFTAGVHGVVIAGVEHLRIAGGEYARFRYKGFTHQIGLAFHYIYGDWMSRANVRFLDSAPALMVSGADS